MIMISEHHDDLWVGVYLCTLKFGGECTYVLYKSMNFTKSGWIEYDVWLTLVINVTGYPRANYFHSF